MHGATLVSAFLLVFPALFSIINPLGGALIFNEAAGLHTLGERAHLARLVAFYAMLIMLGALWGGSYLLNFFGITIAALRIGGGLIVAVGGWGLLHAPEHHEQRKQKDASSIVTADAEDVAFYPLTIPFTTGPGTISVAVALGAERPHGAELLFFFLGASAAAAANAVLIWLAYRFAGNVVALLGPSGTRIVTRLMAFLLLCIGTQIMLNGVEEAFGSIMEHRLPA